MSGHGIHPYYQDDFATLYLGDAIHLSDLWLTADLLVTDPPYGQSWERRFNLNGRKSHPGIVGDNSARLTIIAVVVQHHAGRPGP